MSDDFDCAYTTEIVCPHCGHEFSDSWEYGQREDIGEIQCDSCGYAFFARRIIDVSYCTETLASRRRAS